MPCKGEGRSAFSYLASGMAPGAGTQVLVGGQAELLLEARGKAAGGVVATGEGGLKRSEPLLQQGEGVPQAYLGQHLAKAAPLGGQLADQRGAAHGPPLP